MTGGLTNSQSEYIIDHLKHHAIISGEVSSLLKYGIPSQDNMVSVYFPESVKNYDPRKVIRIDGIPVLYPVGPERDSFYSLQGNSVVFHHDLLKSAFHLLSGYEEYRSGATDALGRFPYKASLQKQLGITTTPVVNYYFEAILEGLEKFCELNGIPFQRNRALTGPVLMLSHDIDRIDAYHFFETAFKFKQLFGLAPSPYDPGGRLRDAFTALYHFLNPFSKKNPFWNFDFLHSSASERGFRSTYFFLEKDGRHDNSRYRFSEQRIRDLMHRLAGYGHEVGLHGTIRSATDPAAMQQTLSNLNMAAPEPVKGVRQHFLKYASPDTAVLQEEAGLIYDATLGFAEHEGFRHSYCWPFRLYDHRVDCPLDLWEIPLNMMDVTMFYYRKLDYGAILRSVEQLAGEVVRFNGIFSLLWHNNFFDEMEFPGITNFYLQLLDRLKSFGMEGIPGKEILQRIVNSR